MSTQNALKTAVTGQVANRPKTIIDMLTTPTAKQQLALAVPRHMTADRMARVAMTEIRKNPKLLQCDPTTLMGAIMQLAQLGLEPGGALGHAYLLPFDNRKAGTVDVQLIVGYRGMIDLARRSGQIVSIEARAVYRDDDFAVTLGLDSDIKHVPAWDKADRGPLTFVYAVAKLKDGGVQFDVMSRAEIEKIRARSKSADRGPWVSDFDEMAKKTVTRRLFKYLPVSIELQRAVGIDEAGESGITFDADFSEVSPAQPEQPEPDQEKREAEQVKPVMVDPDTGEVLPDHLQ